MGAAQAKLRLRCGPLPRAFIFRSKGDSVNLPEAEKFLQQVLGNPTENGVTFLKGMGDDLTACQALVERAGGLVSHTAQLRVDIEARTKPVLVMVDEVRSISDGICEVISEHQRLLKTFRVENSVIRGDCSPMDKLIGVALGDHMIASGEKLTTLLEEVTATLREVTDTLVRKQ